MNDCFAIANIDFDDSGNNKEYESRLINNSLYRSGRHRSATQTMGKRRRASLC